MHRTEAMKMVSKMICAAVIAGVVPTFAAAQCRIAVAGTACVSIPQPLTPAPGPAQIGDVLERGKYSMVMNARYYGLPAVSDGWIYMRIEEDIYRVDWRSHTVLERVTKQASRNW